MKKRITPLVIIFIAILMAAPVFAASGGKGMVTKYMKLYKTDNKLNEWYTYSFSACPQKETKLKKNMKTGAVMYIPTSYLQKGNSLWFSMGISLHTTKLVNDRLPYIGDVASPDSFMILNYDGKICVIRNHDYGSFTKQSAAGSMVTVKKSGNYYVITFKNIPLNNKIMLAENDEFTGEEKALDLKTQFYTNIHLEIQVGDAMAFVKKNVKGNVYVDDMSLKAATNIITTFDQKDYLWFDFGGGGELKGKSSEWTEFKSSLAKLP